MSQIAAAVIKHRKLVMAVFLVAAVVFGVLSFTVPINYSMVDYLPQNAPSTNALKVMEKEFAEAIPNARVMIPHVTVQEAVDMKSKLEAIDGVSGVIWLDDIIDIKVPLEMADTDLVSEYYKDENAVFSLTVEKDNEVAVTDAIYALIGEDGAIAGDAMTTTTSQRMAGAESLNAIIILVPLIILILVLSTSSWLEPVLFLLAIGVAVLINLGTNLFLGEISFVTLAISPILQLAVSLDYAIFLLHRFEEYRTQTDNIYDAMKMAMKKSFTAIASSAATTLFGFIALMFMNFRVGSDLGINLVKGIILSFVSVMVFLPALTLMMHKGLEKTRHKPFLPKFIGISTLSSKVRVPALILVLIIIIPCFLAQNQNTFTYGIGQLPEETRAGRDAALVNSIFGKSNALVMLVPKGDVGKEQALTDALSQLPHVTQIMSYVTTVDATIPPEYLDKAIIDRFYSENYSRIILYTDTDDEGDVAFALVKQVQEIAASYYGEAVHTLGQSVNLLDIKDTINKDNTIVNFIAVASIALVLLITFKSISLPVLLLLTIETAIWINLAVPYFQGSPLVYIGFLVISTVQLGATVDYAILFTDNYRGHRAVMNAKEAIKYTLQETFFSLFVSAAILALTGFVLAYTSSNEIVLSIGMLLGRGALLSILLVIIFLPTLLLIFDKVIQKTTIGFKFYKGE